MLEKIMIVLLVLLSIWVAWYTWKNTRDTTKLQRKLIRSNRLYYLCLKYVHATEENDIRVMENINNELSEYLRDETKEGC